MVEEKYDMVMHSGRWDWRMGKIFNCVFRLVLIYKMTLEQTQGRGEDANYKKLGGKHAM